jgi:hypothetical protein
MSGTLGVRVKRVVFCLVGLVALAVAAPANAGHPGEDAASAAVVANSGSQNMELLANVPKSGTTNSDLAFWGNLVYAGNYNGFRIIDASDPRSPQVLSDYSCPGPQSDVAVWDTGRQRLLITSIDSRQKTEECNSGAGSATAGFEGLRIFDVTNPRSPSLITGVQTDCGSHTHTVVPARKLRNGDYVTDPDSPSRLLVYVSSYPLGPGLGHGDDEESARNSECGVPDNPSGPHNVESIVEVPFSNPAGAQVINQLELGPTTIGCHDIGVHLGADKAAAACLTEGQIWDISNPAEPVIEDRIHNPDVEIWHSGSFTWDAKVAIFGDEEGGAIATHGCNNLVAPAAPGSVWFYDVESPLLPQDSFTQRRGQLDLICTAHNYNVVPGIRPDVFVSSFYSGGTGVVDFTRPFNGPGDAAHPREIGYYDAAAGEAGNAADANTWSTYFYRGLEVANDIDRGVDILRYLGPETRNATRLGHLNPQTQEDYIRPRR